ncbi:glycoside hydrolase family 51 protein [Glonium stellatum]|uniref:non-reducing end alpha-L-arabinofuranosidase n=1 Tax=Glonium stellatum TaxID=574774 RepID=A0A8E2F6U2_9PEZI|nr:glycoside hydrolase family 51 protein [Glonium stellatum]
MASHRDVLFVSLVLLFFNPNRGNGLSLSFSTSTGIPSSPLLYGFMIEDIDHSLDGGLHSQLLQNNGFQGDNPGLTAYAPVGNAVLSEDPSNPVSSAITRSLKITVPENTYGDVGFSNEGYWGIVVTENTYNSSFWLKGSYSGDATVKLVGKTSSIEYASETIHVDSSSNSFSYFEVTLSTRTAPDGENLWVLVFDAEKVTGGSLNVGLIQLFAPTYNSSLFFRPNGLKPELAKPLEDVKASFLRFPGGNNLEGATEADRWKWNETIGPLENRPGRQGDWGYPNTDALGLMEYLLWCEDMELAPVLVIWNGFSLSAGGATPFTGSALQPYVDDVLDELEFILGDTSTEYGALRARYGHPDPFPVQHVEIGNEDSHNPKGCETYPERFMAFYNAIHNVYPDLILITSSSDPQCLPKELPAGVWKDFHIYTDPDSLVQDFNYFDNLDRSFPYVVLEYAVSQTSPPSNNNAIWPYMQGSVAEAVYMIGMERNSDLVKMAAYAPLLAHLNYSMYTPNAISFEYSEPKVVLSTTYYTQKMFSANRGDTILNFTSNEEFGPLYWVVSKHSPTSTYFLKLANYGADTVGVYLTIPGTSEGTLTVLSGPADEFNSDSNPNNIVPKLTDIKGSEGTFEVNLPPWSVAVLAMK